MTTKTVFEVYWETRTNQGTRAYSRTFAHEIAAVPFFATKKNQPATVRAFVREIAVTFDDRGRFIEARTAAVLGTHNFVFTL